MRSAVVLWFFLMFMLRCYLLNDVYSVPSTFKHSTMRIAWYKAELSFDHSSRYVMFNELHIVHSFMHGAMQNWCMHCLVPKWSPYSQVQVMHIIFLMLRTLCKMVHSFTSTSDAHHIPYVTHTLQNDLLIHPSNWCTSYSPCYAHFAKWSPHSPHQQMHIIFTFIPTYPLIPLCFWRLLMPTPNLTV